MKIPIFIKMDRTRLRHCPTCRARLDGATGLSKDPADQARMKPGDVTVCAYCSSVLVVTADGFRLAVEADLADVDPDLRTILLTFPGLRPKQST